jgi:hypothetical protein
MLQMLTGGGITAVAAEKPRILLCPPAGSRCSASAGRPRLTTLVEK